MEQSKRQQNIVGPTVRKLRMVAGLSQEALAAKLQVAGWDLTRAGLSKIEARLRRVNDAELLLLARVLKCDLADLYPKRPADLDRVVRQGSR
ncbi:helix-turn-helix transcriptional regulator [Akkermansiaceae bacterium]|nr:helix-turn-helix transcriptional regulator [Akkermansiaceae bacterium]